MPDASYSLVPRPRTLTREAGLGTRLPHRSGVYHYSQKVKTPQAKTAERSSEEMKSVKNPNTEIKLSKTNKSQQHFAEIHNNAH